MRGLLRAIVLAALLPPAAGLAADPRSAIEWQDWSDGVFREAQTAKKLVLLDLGAVWCHWCHVMDETTYKDPDVARIVRAGFVAVRVDEDSRPDLSNRYEDYGWPATVVFDASGQELVKFSGYVPPPRMTSMLQAVMEDPTPGPSADPEAPLPATGGEITDSLRRELEGLLSERYDKARGGWGFVKKFLDWDSVEWCLGRSADGDKEAESMARETLDAELRLLDPVWGGLYQYSHGGDWENPHFEKIMPVEAENLRVYSLAYGRWHEGRYLRATREIARYMRAFLQSPDGAFYVSQDADLVEGQHGAEYFSLGDSARREKGIPRVDTHTYARETALAANALAVDFSATGDKTALDDSLRAAAWLLTNRALPGGGFRHDEKDAAGPYLSDSLQAARAFLSLFEATGDRRWVAEAEDTGRFIARTFKREAVPGFVTSMPGPGLLPGPEHDENALLARVFVSLAEKTGKREHEVLAAEALAYLAIPEVARRFSTASILLADRDLSLLASSKRPR